MAGDSERRRRALQTDARHASSERERAAQLEQQALALGRLDSLSGVEPTALVALAACGIMRACLPGTVLLNERTPGQFLFIVLRGTISLTLHDRAGRQSLVGVLDRGDLFGEGPLFGDQFRGASARAETICYLLQLPLEALRLALDESLGLTTTLRRIYRRRLIDYTLGRIPLFSQLVQAERVVIATLLQPLQVARGELIIREGGPGAALYLVESGQVIVERAGATIAHLDEGDFFGEMSLLTDQPHNADVRALTPVALLSLPVDEFHALLASQPLLAEQLQRVVTSRREARAQLSQDASDHHSYAAAIGRGALRGTHVLVRDQTLCKPGCTICEHACAERHGQSRLTVAGLVHNQVQITESCRQCRVGAECVESCPEQAIGWHYGGALVVSDACTGCGACVAACPYDAIQLSIPRAERSPLWGLWGEVKRRTRTVIPLIPAETPVQRRAHKCDLCAGHEDLACVSACPTGALRLVAVEEIFPL